MPDSGTVSTTCTSGSIGGEPAVSAPQAMPGSPANTRRRPATSAKPEKLPRKRMPDAIGGFLLVVVVIPNFSLFLAAVTVKIFQTRTKPICGHRRFAVRCRDHQERVP